MAKVLWKLDLRRNSLLDVLNLNECNHWGLTLSSPFLLCPFRSGKACSSGGASEELRAADSQHRVFGEGAGLSEGGTQSWNTQPGNESTPGKVEVKTIDYHSVSQLYIPGSFFLRVKS